VANKVVNLTKYGTPSEDTAVQEEVQSALDSRRRMFGIIPIDALKTMDKMKIGVIADVTLDEVEAVFSHLFGNFQLCDTCDEPATRIGMAGKTAKDHLDKDVEHACDGCKFSTSIRKVVPTEAAESIHRAQAMIYKLKERR
jgi:hypothetical protein